MCDVEFIGGPYDGHREKLGARQPEEKLAWLVCRDVFRLFTETKFKGMGTITSVAIYELEVDDGRFRYRFLRASSVDELTGDVFVKRAKTDRAT